MKAGLKMILTQELNFSQQADLYIYYHSAGSNEWKVLASSFCMQASLYTSRATSVFPSPRMWGMGIRNSVDTALVKLMYLLENY